MAIRVRIHQKSRHATLSGIHYRDLRDILTLAANRCYDELQRKNATSEEREYYGGILKSADLISKSLTSELLPAHGTVPLASLSKDERRARLADTAKRRDLTEKLLALALKASSSG